MRRFYDHLISTVRFPILVRPHLYIETRSRVTWQLSWSCYTRPCYAKNIWYQWCRCDCVRGLLQNYHINGLVQGCNISSVLAVEILQSCTKPSISMSQCKNVLTHWGRDKMAAISQKTHSNAFSWIKMLEIRLIFHWSLFLRVESTILHHWFR